MSEALQRCIYTWGVEKHSSADGNEVAQIRSLFPGSVNMPEVRGHIPRYCKVVESHGLQSMKKEMCGDECGSGSRRKQEAA